jgi:hypothetical protein
MSGMGHLILVICTILFGVFWICNAGIMLTSPKLWFKFSSWSGTQGVMTERQYGNTWGHLQIRLLGAIFLAVSLWVIYDLVSN